MSPPLPDNPHGVVDLTSPLREPRRPKRQFPGADLKIAPVNGNGVLSAVGSHVRTGDDDISSPLTPTYRFVNDGHLQTHTPTIHAHHDHAHEGHSDNMRGVFLHVMAVSDTTES